MLVSNPRSVMVLLLLGLWLGCSGDVLHVPWYEGPALVSPPDSESAAREACTFAAGATVDETLGLGPDLRRRIPITHVIVRMQENRSFDHYFGMLHRQGQPESEPWPEDFTNPDRSRESVAPFHLETLSVEADPPHQWDAMVAQWNGGAMDGFVTTAAVDGSNGHYTMGYYDSGDLPFYYWLASTFAISDRYFSDSLGGTWSNRNFLYTGSAYGVQNTFDAVISEARTIFDALDDAGVRWNVFVDGSPRQDTLGWDATHPGIKSLSKFHSMLARGTLPPVSFVETSPGGEADEHPPFDVSHGERWTEEIYLAAADSPLWPGLALFLNYDTAGGFFDHVPPPEACPPGLGQGHFDRYGFRVPFIVVSPWVKASFVSHQVHSHASVLRFIELVFDLPALSARDANADALLDLFDFEAPSHMVPPRRPTP